MKKIINLKRMVFIILQTVVFTSTISLLGTPQIKDNIIYKGKKYILLHNFPMENYFKKYPDKTPPKGCYVSSTALWRGYVATYVIKENQLYLKDIGIQDGEKSNERGVYSTIWKSVMNEVFPNQKLVKINWVTGLFVLPVGEIKYVIYADPPIGENYIILEMENGILKREKEFTNEEYEEFKKQQFEAFKETEEYEKEKKKLIRKKFTDEEVDSMIQFKIIEYSTKILVE